jgi:hypothetical protein
MSTTTVSCPVHFQTHPSTTKLSYVYSGYDHAAADGVEPINKPEEHRSIKTLPVTFGVITAVTMTITVFWHVMPCNLVDRHQCIGESCCLHLQCG